MTLSEKYLAIVPALNAESTIEELIKRIKASVEEIQIVVVDDGSYDKTSEIAEANGAVVLNHENNRGKGSALQTGFDYVKNISKSEFVITIDADLQHQPEDIGMLIFKQQESCADIVIGWRERIGTRMPVHRILSNTITSAMVSMRTGIKVRDSQCGFRLIKRSVIEKIQLESKGYEAETEFLIKSGRAGFTIDFIPIKTIYGNEKSYMTHWETTVNFVKVLFRDYV